jgi:hypothetical protein
MAKMITATELSEIFNKMLTGEEIDDADQFSEFMTKAAALVCDFCGGEVLNPASFAVGESNIDSDNWMVGIHHTEEVPENGGIWKDYDTDESFDTTEDSLAVPV